MAIATCPKCATKLKVPDGTTASVRCPKCQTVFKSSAPPAAAPAPQFEVVDEPAPPPKAAPKPPPRAAVPAPAPSPAPKEESPFSNLDDDDDDDRPRKKKSRDDDDDDRPQKKKRRDDDDDEDDRPRSKKRNRDDDDDEDDRPRKKKSRDDDDEDDDRPRSKKRSRDDDDEDDRPRKKKSGGGAGLGLARTGVLLLLISLGIYVATMGLQALFLLIAIVGGVVPSGMGLLTGLLGLVNWIVGLVGAGLCIGGPSRSRGLAITAVSVAAVHLILGFIAVNDKDSVEGGSGLVRGLSGLNRAVNAEELSKELQKEFQKNPGSQRAKDIQEELKSMREDGKGDGFGFEGRASRKSDMRWDEFATAMTTPDRLIAVLSYASKGFSNYLLGLFWGLTEIARLILICLLMGSLAGVAKEYGAQSRAKLGWILAASASGAGLLIMLLAFVIADNSTDAKEMAKNGESIMNIIRKPIRWLAIGEFLCVAVHAASIALPAMAAASLFFATKSGGGGRKRPSRRDEDDDEDDRPRKKRSRRDDDEDDD